MKTDMSKASSPLLSIGMPAFNGALTIRSAIDCLLEQSFSNFELIISDNASTDGTWAIIEEYTRKDARVIGLRQSQNIGANANYSAVFLPARGRYFKWASSNDWCAPTMLERCIDYLEGNPDAVLVAPRTRLFQNSVDEFSEYLADIACPQANPVDRFIEVGSHLALNNAVNGVLRTQALRRTRLVEHYRGADVVLLAHLALLGKISLLDAPLFYRRMDAATATHMMSGEAVHLHHYPVKTSRSLFPAWRLTWGWMRAAAMARLSPRDTLRAVAWVLRKMYWSRSEMTHDLVEVVRPPRHR
jgi:glycosyltransferase involved in cell wall biosynthesis